MLDSGASCHMIGDAPMLSEIKKIALVAIRLPNGGYTAARDQGLAALNENVKLENVFLVPSLKCNCCLKICYRKRIV